MPPKAVAYHSGNVYTVSSSQPHAEAFIVGEDGSFLTIGSDAEVLAIAQRDGLATYNLDGAFVMPGIHDAHVHLLWAGMISLSSRSLGMGVTSHDLPEKLKSCSCHCTGAYGDWIVGDTLAIEEFDREHLDKIYPDTPVAVRGAVGHSMLMNTAAMKKAGYDENEPDQSAHLYMRRPDGTLTGEVAENAQEKVFFSMPRPDPEHVKRAVMTSVRKLHECGVTSVQEASASKTELIALQQLDNAALLKMNVAAHIAVRPTWLHGEQEDIIADTLEKAETYRTPHVATNFAKFILDGVPISPIMTQAGLTSDGEVVKCKILAPDFLELARPLDRKGMTIKSHATGVGSVRFCLDRYEQLRRENPNGPRHEVAHCNAVRDDDRSRFRRLDVTAEMSPANLFAVQNIAIPDGLADWNFANMLDVGAHVTIGTDLYDQPDADLFGPCMTVMESVLKSKMVRAESEQERKREAAGLILRMLTLSGAEAVGREAFVGSIEVGKWANFVVVSKDLAKGEFEGARVMQTWFEGGCVFRRDTQNAREDAEASA
ncbi:N-substituted formamide deformylase [Cyphellophora attinorum]|uniref:N-substituted formamide deformylase n=1 Tax=Cyphellophora attinorum TaxID=1664694 RepID=A0A0N1HPE7_9EURO|nr:N-substituted formamide deformylase [Phialophora attinorum]KPI39600.1 N-substituted formamide deformylase [Phialophora attinorum]